MDTATETMTADLRDELAANSNAATPIDPRTRPARFHNLKEMGRSPLHCFESFQDDSDRSSLALRLGAGTHALLFGQPVAVFTGKVRNGKVWDAFKAEHDGTVILNAKEHARAEAISNAIRSHEIASRLLFSPGTRHEESILWEQDGRARRSTPDARGAYHLVELKTTRCAQPDRFMRDAMFRAYHAQVADYRAAIEASVGVKPRDCYIIAVESVRPCAVTVLRLTDRALEMGDRLCRLWMERLRACEASNEWPPYCQSATDFDVPDDELDLVFGDEAEVVE